MDEQEIVAILDDMREHGVATERRDGILHATCLVCDQQTHVPDKGIGRANLFAWRTRHQHVIPSGSTAEKDARSSHIEHITSELLLTDALTGNDEGTPTHYTVPADDVEYLVRTVLDLASQIHEERIAHLAAPTTTADDTEETP